MKDIILTHERYKTSGEYREENCLWSSALCSQYSYHPSHSRTCISSASCLNNTEIEIQTRLAMKKHLSTCYLILWKAKPINVSQTYGVTRWNKIQQSWYWKLKDLTFLQGVLANHLQAFHFVQNAYSSWELFTLQSIDLKKNAYSQCKNSYILL